MISIVKQISYWRDGAIEDWSVAQDFVARGKIRHGLFFAHLALEKTLKAHFCKATGELAVKTHNLVRLAEKTGILLTGWQK